MAFIVQKAFQAQNRRMRGLFVILASGIIGLSAGMSPDVALARENENETVACTEPKHRHAIVRPLTEPVPIRKVDRIRVRRILM